MNLPILPPYPAMDAQTVAGIPKGDNWQYEPKWDGFRAIVFRDGAEIELQSKSGQALGRYFPELVEALLAVKASKFVLDGEIMVVSDGAHSFDSLLQRIHPAASRVRKLSVETPAEYIVFDLLVDEHGAEYASRPVPERRKRLEAFFKRRLKGPRFHLSPATRDHAQAMDWWNRPGTDLDGVIAKRADLPYKSGERSGMVKVKKLRTADCVVGGYRLQTGEPVVGSLLLGLYDSEGLLHHVGFTSSMTRKDRPEITAQLKPLIGPPGFTGNAPGGPSRWSTERSAEWTPLKPKLVVEVQYDHVTNGRFRHGTRFLRWRPDKAPRQCTFDQLGIAR
ncbi:MAG: ATP-dependent DNA ligase [Bryobacteraceae bacterium]|nr:ATP-dependent DNA ligase [Bryobacteraceae bacterium]